MNALITGASGFIGRHLAAALNKIGWSVTGLSRHECSGFSSVVMGTLPWDRERLESILDCTRPDVVFHLLGASPSQAAEQQYCVNLQAGVELVSALERQGRLPRIIFAGSAAEYGPVEEGELPLSEARPCNPLGPYGASKLEQTKFALAKASDLPVVVARIFNPIGPGMGRHLALGDFVSQLARSKERPAILSVGNLDVFRDFIDVRDLVAILVRLSTNPQAIGRVLNVCSGRGLLLRDIVARMVSLSGKDVKIEVEQSRVRSTEMKTFYGSARALNEIGIAVPALKLDQVLAAMLAHEQMSHP